jgi:hypothetical protein
VRYDPLRNRLGTDLGERDHAEMMMVNPPPALRGFAAGTVPYPGQKVGSLNSAATPDVSR